MSELYVYYRLLADDAAAARAAFEAARGDSAVRLMQSAGAPLTWMEIYSGPVQIAQAAEQRIAAAMIPYAQGGRHHEIFQTLA